LTFRGKGTPCTFAFHVLNFWCTFAFHVNLRNINYTCWTWLLLMMAYN
jgi:hypothetical protein